MKEETTFDFNEAVQQKKYYNNVILIQKKSP